MSRSVAQASPRKKVPQKAAVKKRSWLPPIVGLMFMLIVFGMFHAQLIAGHIMYFVSSRTVAAESASAPVVTTSSNKHVDLNAPTTIKINKIKVNAPVIYTEAAINENSFQKALQNGTVHFPFTANPGEKGNVVIFGHSSGALWRPGKYKFVFTLLEKLDTGDQITVEYQGNPYVYRVTGERIVMPTEVSVLSQNADAKLTLITCYPIGSNAKRLIIEAEQISPAPQSETPQNKPNSPLPTLPLSPNAESAWQQFNELF